MPNSERLGQILKRKGLITGSKLVKALDEQKLRGLRLGEILVAQGLLTEKDLVFALSEQSKIPVINFSRAPVSAQALALVHRQIALDFMVMPVTFVKSLQGPVLVVAMESPPAAAFLQKLTRLTGHPIKPMLASKTQILSAIAEAYRQISQTH